MDMILVTSASPSNEGQQAQPFWQRTFDPKSRVIIYWNRFLFVIGILNIVIDVLSLFITSLDNNNFYIDFKLGNLIILLRMIGDSCQFLGIIVKFRTAIDGDRANGVSKSQELVKDPTIIAKKYLKSSFIVELFATLPLMQVYLWYKLSRLRTWPKYTVNKFLSKLVRIFGIQFLPRVYILFLLRNKLIVTGDTFMRPAWSGAVNHLLFYVMLSQFVGALYYVSYINLLLECRGEVQYNQASSAILRWDELLKECARDDQIEQGIFSELHKNEIASRSFLQRYMYCFSWGLKCLSSMGQNFNTSASTFETIFSFMVTISGLILFAGLIAQMQTCIQSMEPGEEQRMVRQREVEEWAKNHQLPPELKKLLRQTVEFDWSAFSGLKDDTMLGLLPTTLQCDIRRHLYFDHACNLPFFANMDCELARSFIGHLRTFSCSKDTYVVIEGEPVKLILFIFNGELEIFSVNDRSSHSTLLGAGDLCGSELLTWASLPSSSNQNLPSSSQSVKCLTDIEAFSLRAEDLKLLGIHYNYSSKFQLAMRWHS